MPTFEKLQRPTPSVLASAALGSSLTPRAAQTPFRLAITQVSLSDSGALERALRRLASIEWERFDYASLTETMRAEGRLPCGIERALDVYLPQLSYCAWDVVWTPGGPAARESYPKAVLYLNPDAPEEQRHSLNRQQFGQYKRRRREFEACGGIVLDRWGIQKPSPINQDR